jgi:hypothetical protein
MVVEGSSITPKATKEVAGRFNNSNDGERLIVVVRVMKVVRSLMKATMTTACRYTWVLVNEITLMGVRVRSCTLKKKKKP